ncbi:MAG: DMT family transporter [Gammaproteobacteria bacterium]|nr:DMT family transporter [Gammaproteobacteria bacterium]
MSPHSGFDRIVPSKGSFGEWVPLALDAWLRLALSGLGFGFGIFLVTDALRYAEVSLLSPVKYTGVVWAVGLGYLLWDEIPTMLVTAGALAIVGSDQTVFATRGRISVAPVCINESAVTPLVPNP